MPDSRSEMILALSLAAIYLSVLTAQVENLPTNFVFIRFVVTRRALTVFDQFTFNPDNWVLHR